MKASIAHRTLGRTRFLFQDKLEDKDVNKLKYKIESIEGVKNARISILSSSIVVDYEEEILPKICRFILGFDISSLCDFEIEDSDFIAQDEVELFHILRNAFYRRFFFKYFVPMPIRPFLTIIRAYPFIRNGLKALYNRKLNVDVLDATAIGVSLATRSFKDAANIMFLLSLGEDLEDYTLKKSRDNLAHSLALNIDKVFVIENDQKILKNLEDVEIGDIVEISMGSTIPVDGVVTKGIGMVNESSFTGESKPIKKTSGKTVFAGTALEEGDLLVRTTKKYDDSRINHIINLIGESEKNKSEAQKRAESAADSIVKYSFIGAGLTYLLTRNFTKAKSFLMVDFSCALKLTIPIAVMKAMSQSSERDVLVKGGKFLEKLAIADTIVFDKTGTLTKSEPKVAKVIAFEGRDENECLRVAACLEEHFPHSIASAVVKAAKDRHLNHEEMHSKPEYIVAHGIKSTIDSKPALIGSEHFIVDDENVPISDEKRNLIENLKGDYSLLFLAYDNELIAVICIEDPLREDAKYTIDELRNLGFTEIAMLTGDAENAASAVAQKLNLDYYKSQVLPEDKQEYIKEKKREKKAVIMIGDGINDSIALSNADVGISMHKGAAIAKEISDVSIGSDSLRELIDVIKISRSFKNRVSNSYRNIISFNGSLIVLGLLGIISNTSSALLHNTATVAIAANNMKNYKI